MRIGSPEAVASVASPPAASSSSDVLHAAPDETQDERRVRSISEPSPYLPAPGIGHSYAAARTCQDRYRLPLGVRMRKNPALRGAGCRATHTSETIGEEVRERLGEMTPSERRVARTLLATYPTAGLESLPQLADGAGVTGPTVLRFVRKIGFDGYPDFQRSLRREVQARTEGLPSLYRTKGATPGDDVVRRSHEAFTRRARRDVRVELAGGRPRARSSRCSPTGSAACGSWAGASASSSPPTCVCSCGCCGRRARWWARSRERRVLDSLEVARRDVLCLFDYRRYQHDTIAAGKVAADARRGGGRLHRPVAVAGRRVRSARADLARGLGVAVRLAAGRVRARRGDRREGGGGARRGRPHAGRGARGHART